MKIDRAFYNGKRPFLMNYPIFRKTPTCANIFYAAERSLDDSVSESTGSDIKFFALTFTIMGTFSAIINGRCGDYRFGTSTVRVCFIICNLPWCHKWSWFSNVCWCSFCQYGWCFTIFSRQHWH